MGSVTSRVEFNEFYDDSRQEYVITGTIRYPYSDTSVDYHSSYPGIFRRKTLVTTRVVRRYCRHLVIPDKYETRMLVRRADKIYEFLIERATAQFIVDGPVPEYERLKSRELLKYHFDNLSSVRQLDEVQIPQSRWDAIKQFLGWKFKYTTVPLKTVMYVEC